MLFARREAAVYRGYGRAEAARRPASDSGVRRGRRGATEEWAAICGYGPGQLRWDPLRRGWQRVVGGGMGGRKLQRCARVRAGRKVHRQDSYSGDVREHLLWRREEEPAVYGGEHVAVCGVCGRARRADAVRKSNRQTGKDVTR